MTAARAGICAGQESRSRGWRRRERDGPIGCARVGAPAVDAHQRERRTRWPDVPQQHDGSASSSHERGEASHVRGRHGVRRPDDDASKGRSAARLATFGGAFGVSVATLRDVTVRLVTANRSSSSSARRTNVDIHDGRGSNTKIDQAERSTRVSVSRRRRLSADPMRRGHVQPRGPDRRRHERERHLEARSSSLTPRSARSRRSPLAESVDRQLLRRARR